MIKQQKGSKMERNKRSILYNLNLSIPMLSKLFKTAQNRFSLTISSQLTKFPNHLAFSIKSPHQKKKHILHGYAILPSNNWIQFPHSKNPKELLSWHLARNRLLSLKHRQRGRPLGRVASDGHGKFDHLRPVLNNSPWKGIHEGHGHSSFFSFQDVVAYWRVRFKKLSLPSAVESNKTCDKGRPNWIQTKKQHNWANNTLRNRH